MADAAARVVDRFVVVAIVVKHDAWSQALDADDKVLQILDEGRNVDASIFMVDQLQKITDDSKRLTLVGIGNTR